MSDIVDKFADILEALRNFKQNPPQRNKLEGK